MQHHSALDLLLLILQSEDAEHGIVECTTGLHNVIADMSDR